MVSYGQYCPVAKAAEVLGERWTLLIVRELLAGVEGFNELQRLLPGISRSVLAQRLRTLERRGIVDRAEPRGYRLTAAGSDLARCVDTLGEWGAKWAFGDPPADELDPDLVMAWIARHTDPAKLREAPGFDADVLVEADAEQLYGLYFGRTTLRDAAIAVRGAARGDVDSWFTWSEFAAGV